MSTLQIVLLLLVLVDLALGGLISNSFIVTVICREWTKNRSLASIDKLILSLVLSNFWAVVLVIPLFINDYIIHFVISNCGIVVMYPFSDFILLCRFWLTAWLCVFYCIKIVNSTNSLFLLCKLKISWLLPRLIAGSLGHALFCTCFVFYFVLRSVRSKTMNDTNVCHEVLRNHTVNIPEVTFLVVGSGPPLLVVLLCSILVVASLGRHVCQMKGKELHLTSFQTKGHVKAAGTVLFFLFLYLSFYIAQTFSMSISLGKIEGIVVTIVMLLYSPAQAYTLLLVYPKLNQAAIWMFSKRET